MTHFYENSPPFTYEIKEIVKFSFVSMHVFRLGSLNRISFHLYLKFQKFLCKIDDGFRLEIESEDNSSFTQEKQSYLSDSDEI